ncbi:hypothetical protein NIASO_06335 [Niabella soli DSM 19437]|uniref:Uncharacterized protein n=1 Tax=Niabella soli DSM 19437 TaxID=929713 RepID=W0F7P3_9BACT|nr:hypothetical protein NIASO_06335 [Niabella soli DSM 19437]
MAGQTAGGVRLTLPFLRYFLGEQKVEKYKSNILCPHDRMAIGSHGEAQMHL